MESFLFTRVVLFIIQVHWPELHGIIPQLIAFSLGWQRSSKTNLELFCTFIPSHQFLVALLLRLSRPLPHRTLVLLRTYSLPSELPSSSSFFIYFVSTHSFHPLSVGDSILVKLLLLCHETDRPAADANISTDTDINDHDAISDGMHASCGDQTDIITSVGGNSAAHTNDVEVCYTEQRRRRL